MVDVGKHLLIQLSGDFEQHVAGESPGTICCNIGVLQNPLQSPRTRRKPFAWRRSRTNRKEGRLPHSERRGRRRRALWSHRRRRRISLYLAAESVPSTRVCARCRVPDQEIHLNIDSAAAWRGRVCRVIQASPTSARPLTSAPQDAPLRSPWSRRLGGVAYRFNQFALYARDLVLILTICHPCSRL